MILTVVSGLLLVSPAYVLLVLRDFLGLSLHSSFIGGIILFIIGLVLAIVTLNKRQAVADKKPV